MKNVQPKIWPSYSLQYISIKIKNLKTTFFLFLLLLLIHDRN